MSLQATDPRAALPSGLQSLLNAPDVQQELQRSGIAGDVKDLLKQHGGDVRKALAAMGVDLKSIASQAGLPPAAGALFALPGVLSAKGTEGKVIAAAEAAQTAVSALVGPAGPASAAINQLITDSLGIKKTAASAVGGSIGMATGAALLGPAGGFIGQGVGTAAGAGVKAVGKALGLTTSQKEQRARRETQRVKDDVARLKGFKYNRGAVKLNEAFNAGKIVFTQGIPGSTKYDGEIQHFIVRGGKVVPISRADVEAMFVRGGKEPYIYADKLLLTSIHMSNQLLKTFVKYEAVIGEQKAQEQLTKVKRALVSGLKQAAAKKRSAPRASTPKAPTAPTRNAKLEAQVRQLKAAQHAAVRARDKAQAALKKQMKLQTQASTQVPNAALLKALTEAQAQAAQAIAIAQQAQAQSTQQMQQAQAVASAIPQVQYIPASQYVALPSAVNGLTDLRW